MSRRLDNYLRTHRRRAGLSQDEVAYLLGSTSGTKVSRHETSVRRPGLETLFAYEIIYRIPARELFAGIYERVERTTARRARLLKVWLRKLPADPLISRKLVIVKAVYDPTVDETVLRDGRIGIVAIGVRVRFCRCDLSGLIMDSSAELPCDQGVRRGR